ncbi:MAG: Limonene 1,2-monooxygenase [Stenotrophomonas maltophilia]|nr:MAG: Limonene 1,2-monooxygenase [Stenotrophomonas maltophilia]
MTSLSEIAFSMLDLVPVRDQGTVREALDNAVEIARHVERLGFSRYWMAEHHNMDGIASSATSVLIGHIASKTARIRVGSGGVMLPNHPPLVIAEQFGTLATLYPGRIDLGLGRAPGADQATMRALRRDRLGDGDDFPEQVAELEMLLGPRRVQQTLLAVPGEGTRVPIWLLGSSLFSARLAAEKGLPYAFASHFAPRYLHDALRVYRQNFKPSAILDEPYAMIGVPLIAAATDEEADFLATTAFQRVLALLRGQSLKQKPPVSSMAGLWLPHEQDAVGNFFGLAVIGGPEKVRSRLEVLVAQTGANELIFTSDIYDHAARALAGDRCRVEVNAVACPLHAKGVYRAAIYAKWVAGSRARTGRPLAPASRDVLVGASLLAKPMRNVADRVRLCLQSWVGSKVRAGEASCRSAVLRARVGAQAASPPSSDQSPNS